MSNTTENTSGLDVDQERIGSVYGKALLDATTSSGTTARVIDELDSLVSDILAQLPDFERLLTSPRVPTEEKIRILDSVLESRLSEDLLTFLKVVCRRDRLDCLREISREARKQFNEMLGVIQVHVTSATPIDESLTGLIENVLRGVLRSEISLVYTIDPKLIGGLVIRAGDTVFDGSVINQLERLRSQALEQSFRATVGVLDKFIEENTSA
tara:strand:- start:527 stop:1162 length:636 start_codon:yes stop_codon:yes gene_type:complete